MYYQTYNPYQMFQQSPNEELFGQRDKSINSSRFYDIKEGFESGNILKNEYLPYRDFKIPVIKASNDKEAKMIEVMSLYNYLHDLNLLLDVFPTDKEALSLFNNVLEKYKTVREEYINKFGPLTIEDVRTDKGTFPYVLVPSPWINK